MPKRLPTDLNDQIISAVARHPGGVGVDAIALQLGDIVSRRTLQRRLRDLVDQERLSAEGSGKARVYRAPDKPTRQTVETNDIESAKVSGKPAIEAYVPISPESRELRAYVRQPVPYRKPVGYEREFLAAYTPNRTFYLTDEVRQHLRQIGRSPRIDQHAGTYARDILNRLLIDLSWASSRLEGNTYSRLDTQNLIEFGKEAEGKDRTEAQMILNHKAAIELLVEQVDDIGFNRFTFLNLHALLSDNLLADATESGRLRTRIVEISGTVYHPLGIPQQIDEYFSAILEKADAIHDAFEQAFFLMVHIPYLQPFIDVNKRVSRLGANLPLIKHNLCPLSFVDVPENAYVEGTLCVYELQSIELLRDVFVWAYERSSQRYLAIQETVADPDPMRLLHREALISVVGDIVRDKQPPTEDNVRRLALRIVPESDLDPFVELACKDLRNLHEGNVSRYRIRLSEYREWQSVHATGESGAAKST